MNKKFAIVIVSVLMLALQACSSTTPTPISEPTETTIRATFTPTATSTPTPTMTPTSTPTPIPLAWQQIYDGQEFLRDTVTAFATDKNDPNVIYAAMKNTGVYKTIDGGLSWQLASHSLTSMQVESLLIDSQNPHILYAGTAGGVFKTEDSGENWIRIGDGTYLLMDLQINSHIYARDENAIYETIDQGNTWTTAYVLGKSCPDVVSSWAIHPADGNTLFVGGGERCAGVYQSGNGGQSWKLIGMEDKSNLAALAIGLDEQGNYSIYTYYDSPIMWEEFSGIYVSHDGGTNWFRTRIQHCDVLTSDPEHPSAIYCATNMLYVTLKKGAPWQELPGTYSLIYTAIHIDHPNGTNRIIAGATDVSTTSKPIVGIFISEDDGITWIQRDNGLRSTRGELKIDPLDSAKIYLATYFAGVNGKECQLYRSLDHGKNWPLIKWRSGVWCGPTFDTAHVLYLNEGGKLQQSRNGGDTWLWDRQEGPYSNLNNRNSGVYIDRSLVFALPSDLKGSQSVSANPYIEGLVYDVGNRAFYYSTNEGTNWYPSAGSDDIFDARLFYTDQSKMIFAVGRYHQAFSTDNGVTWQNCGEDVSASQSDTRLALDLGGSRLYLATPGQGVLVSSDSCGSWQPSNEGLSNLFVNTVAVDPNNPDILYAGTDGGAYISFNSGETWSQINEGLLSTTVVYSIAIDPESNVYAATPYGIYQLEGK